MESLLKKQKIVFRLLYIVPILIVILVVVHVVTTIQFNKKTHVSTYSDVGTDVYCTISGRTDSGSSWQKANFPITSDKHVNLDALIYDSYITNTSGYTLTDWTLRINIKGDIYLNNAWNGQMEIHQNAYTEDEVVQTLTLGSYDESEIELEHTVFDGDLMIPLHKGDFVIYYPSEDYGELPVGTGKENIRSMGFILDYLEEPALTDYSFSYTLHRNWYSGWTFYAILAVAAVWLVMIVTYIVSVRTYKATKREMELRKSSISSMSELYSIIYIIDLDKDELTPIGVDAESEKYRPKNMGANEQLRNLFLFDSEEAYQDITLKFADMTTVRERMENQNTIVCEYVSKHFGWSRLRIFAMDREPGKPLEKLIFTIQNIEQEKSELEAVNARVEKAETESKSKSTFLANMSHEIRTPINTVLGLNTMILRESKEKATIAYAKDIKGAANMLLSLINSILDFSKMEAGKMELVPTEYSMRQLLKDTRSMVITRFEAKDLRLDFEVSPAIPNHLYGDEVRIKQILINLLTNAAKYTHEGGAKLSIFGKQEEDSMHLLISVKDTGMGIREEDIGFLTQRFARLDEKKNHKIEGTGIGLNLVTGLLGLMDSELKVVSQYGEGSEFYFEIVQKVMDPEPIGNLDFSEQDAEGEDYAASFQAPDACVLAVDDNPLNLTVIENLLKETKLQIEKAMSGKQALEMTKAKKYDLIFMDHMMPEMDGVETFHAIREDSTNPNADTKILVLTANALKGAEEEYRAIGFEDFIPKPIQPEILEAKIIEHLDPSKYKKGSFKTLDQGGDNNKSVDIPKIDGLDTTYGLQHTGGFDSLLKVMEQFDTVAGTDLEELLSYYEKLKDDPKNSNILSDYRIKVHAMKSSARVMGAIALSGMAETLENLAKSGNVDGVVAITPYLAADWTRMKEEMDAYFKVESKGDTDVDPQVVGELLHRLDTSMNAYDVKGSDDIMKQLEQYSWNEKQQKLFAELKTAVANLDAEKTSELCTEMLKE